MRFIGDVHAKFNAYKKIIKDCEASIQVGDMGVGFPIDYTESKTCPPVIENHKFIRGNHDDPAMCRRLSTYIPDGTYDPIEDIMFIGGAESIDKHLRYPYLDWWPEEELSTQEFYNFIGKYENIKPSIMVTHDCPKNISDTLFGNYVNVSRTQGAFNAMWESYKPNVWIFGHYHKNVDKTILGCRFICLAELSYIDM